MNDEQRPREKALAYGMASLSDRELLALILRSGYKGRSALEMADDLLAQNNGLSGLMTMSLSQIIRLKGIKLAKAAELLAAVELVNRLSYRDVMDEDVVAAPQMLVKWLQKTIGNQQQEYFVVVFLDVRNHVRGHEVLYKGSSQAIIIEARDIFQSAIKANANRLIIAHNHPSQIPLPSSQDRDTTKALVNAGNLMSIPVLDHLVVSYDQYYSFKEHGCL